MAVAEQGSEERSEETSERRRVWLNVDDHFLLFFGGAMVEERVRLVWRAWNWCFPCEISDLILS